MDCVVFLIIWFEVCDLNLFLETSKFELTELGFCILKLIDMMLSPSVRQFKKIHLDSEI